MDILVCSTCKCRRPKVCSVLFFPLTNAFGMRIDMYINLNMYITHYISQWILIEYDLDWFVQNTVCMYSPPPPPPKKK